MVSAQDIPDWINNIAKWWSEDKISDSEFINSIEFLINNKIIVIQIQENSDVETTEKIPSWIKLNAGWWSNEEIDDKTFLQGIEFLVETGIIHVSLPSKEIVEFSGNSPLFTKYAYKNDFRNINGEMIPIETHFKLKTEMQETYNEIGFFNEKSNAIVIAPLFTSTAYWEPGFYTYYRNECGTECLTKKIEFEKPFGFSASDEGFKILKLLNYHTISDFEMAKNPDIINEYEKVIILHNEYVTKEMFKAITQHPKVMYLYPNALYAEVEYNQEDNTITLVRGHGYPEKIINNGFDWEFDNTNPYEFDVECINWKFYEIDNGKMLNCFPENKIYSDLEMLKEIKDY